MFNPNFQKNKSYYMNFNHKKPDKNAFVTLIRTLRFK